jgi:hypothetical protein
MLIGIMSSVSLSAVIRQQKISVVASVADPGCLSQIPDPDFSHPGSRIPDPKKHGEVKKLFLYQFSYLFVAFRSC